MAHTVCVIYIILQVENATKYYNSPSEQTTVDGVAQINMHFSESWMMESEILCSVFEGQFP